MGKVVRDKACAWPSEWVWHPTDTLSTKLSSADAEWLNAWLPSRCAPADASEISFLQYTSGSTGQPKGVMVGTRNLLCNVHAMKQASDRTAAAGPGERICMVSWLPQYHDMGLVGGCLSSAVLGWRSDLMSPHAFLAKPVAWLQAISRLSPTHEAISVAPNFGYALALRRVPSAALSSLSLRHWTLAMNGAEPIRPGTLRDFSARFGACGFDPSAWTCLYGLAETCLYACGKSERVEPLFVSRARLGAGDAAMPAPPADNNGWRAEDWLECPGVYVRPPDQTGQTIRIAHPDSGRLMADGRVGEVRMAGGSVALGYWRQDELSASTFGEALRPGDRDVECAEAASCKLETSKPIRQAAAAGEAAGGAAAAGMITWDSEGATAGEEGSDVSGRAFLRTGDLGFLWESRLFLVGRIKDVICLKGRTLHAHDVEALAEQACVSLRPGCCAAFPLLAPDGNETLGLMAELRPEAVTAESGLDALVADINRGLANEGIRASAVTLLRARSILKTTSGKLRRRDCRAAHEEIAAAMRLSSASEVRNGSPNGGAGTGTAAGGRIPLDAVLHYWSEMRAATSPSHGASGRLSTSPSAASLATTRTRSHGDLTSGSTTPSVSPTKPSVSNGEAAQGNAPRGPLTHAQLDPRPWSPVASPVKAARGPPPHEQLLDLRPPSPVPTHHPDGRPLSKLELLAAESSALFHRVVVIERNHWASKDRRQAQLSTNKAPPAHRALSACVPGAKYYPNGGYSNGGHSWSHPVHAKAAAAQPMQRRSWMSERSLADWVKLALVAAVITAIALK